MSEKFFYGEVVPLPDARFSRADRIWQGVPTIECTAGGRLYAAWYSGGSTEPSLYNYIIIARSDDGGITWREITAVNGDAERRMQMVDPQFWTAPNGQLWCFLVKRDWNVGPKDQRHLSTAVMICDNPDATELVFSEPKFVCQGFVRNRPLILADGRWLLPAYRFAGERCAYFESTDQGASFQLREAGKKLETDYDETMFFQRQDGILVLWYRVNPKYGRIAQCLSHDGGQSWNDSELTDIPNQQTRFYISRLPSGRLLLINNFDAKERVNLRICLSEDDGKSWPYQLLLDGRDDVSYPDVSLAPDGALYIIHDRARPIAKEILCSRIYEEEIIAGKLSRPQSYQNNIVSKGPASPVSGNEYLRKFQEFDTAFSKEYWHRKW